MRAIDEIHLKHPYFGVRRIADALRDKPYERVVNRKCLHRLMRLMGTQAEVYLRRLQLHNGQAPEDWEGVFTHTAK